MTFVSTLNSLLSFVKAFSAPHCKMFGFSCLLACFCIFLPFFFFFFFSFIFFMILDCLHSLKINILKYKILVDLLIFLGNMNFTQIPRTLFSSSSLSLFLICFLVVVKLFALSHQLSIILSLFKKIFSGSGLCNNEDFLNTTFLCSGKFKN